MDLKFRIPWRNFKSTDLKLYFITIIILIYIAEGSRSLKDEAGNQYNQRIRSDLTEKIHEIPSIHEKINTGELFQSTLDSDNEHQLLLEGYSLVNYQDVETSQFLLTTPDESMHGSGSSIDEETTSFQTQFTTINFTSTMSTTTVTSSSIISTGATVELPSSPTITPISTEPTTATDVSVEPPPTTTGTFESTIATVLIESTIATGAFETTTGTITTKPATSTPGSLESTTATGSIESTASRTSSSQTTMTTTAAVESTTTTTVAIEPTLATTPRPQVCAWTNWMVKTNCTPDCGLAYREIVRYCIDTTTGVTCTTDSQCGGGLSATNERCSSSPPCDTSTVAPPTSERDPNIRITSYALPDTLYFFERTYHRIWITNKGYITFDIPYYGQTMTGSVFQQLANQAIAAPFWADMIYVNGATNMTINWFSSINTSCSDADEYCSIIRSAIISACPTSSCPLNFAAARAVRISWQNLLHVVPYLNRTKNISFSTYLINTYEYAYANYSYPILRSYLVFDYRQLMIDPDDPRPFVGYRGEAGPVQVLNDRFYYENAGFLSILFECLKMHISFSYAILLAQHKTKSFYVGGRFLSQCEVSFLEETTINILSPWENLNDIIINPRFPCPCTLRQAEVDTRFGRLFSETQYEIAQNLVCYAPRTLTSIHLGQPNKLLKSQTCCYHWHNQALVTSGTLAGSVLSNPYILFQPNPSQRRIPFYDQCCLPLYSSGLPDWHECRLYFQLHPASNCTGYRPPAIVTGVGDPHVNTIDDGEYTCHIQGLFIFAQTTDEAKAIAYKNLVNTIFDINLIYPDDLFTIYVRSTFVPPALRYIEREKGHGSIFSSYTIVTEIFTFGISNNDGKFGFTVNNDATLSAILSNNMNYDYINTMNYTQPHMYRVQQTIRSSLDRTISQLTISLWSGLSMQFEIIGENLECVLLLPEKFRMHIEGLAGNYNGYANDDLINRNTGQTIPIINIPSINLLAYDQSILSACLSWRVSNDTTPISTFTPIMPRSLVEWYYTSASSYLESLNPFLSQTVVNRTCHGNYECEHDYLIRINSFTSEATASGLESIHDARISLREIPPTIDLNIPVQITLPVDVVNRNYALKFNTAAGSGTAIRNITVVIYPSNTPQNISVGESSITVPIPNNADSYVEVLLTIQYGLNSTWEKYLDIQACLCKNNGTCNFEETTAISSHYQLTSCDCPALYDGIFCELEYDVCKHGSACRENWESNTTCTRLNTTQPPLQFSSYYCNGECQAGYVKKDNTTCEDIDECSFNSSICGNGTCSNLSGSYSCNCPTGYRFADGTCIDIDECSEPNINGSFILPCENSQDCHNLIGNHSCKCSPIFSMDGNCTFNSSLCNFTIQNTCIGANGTILCLNGTVNINGSCSAWCNRTCPDFCDLVNNSFQCNCQKYPGYEYAGDGKCLPCRGENYGVGCSEPCQCINGKCNKNATNVNDSCICEPGYQKPDCVKLMDQCENNNPCNSSTADCTPNPNNGSAICTCKRGYEKFNLTSVCTDIDECGRKMDNCTSESSVCHNTIGSYECICKNGYQLTNGSCVDIDECNISTTCNNYNNTYCANIPGLYECRCKTGYAVEGDRTQTNQNILNTNRPCLRTDLSADCQNQCTPPAYCDATSGECACQISHLILSDLPDPSKRTCLCIGYPFVEYKNQKCSSASPAWLLLQYSLTQKSRIVKIPSYFISIFKYNISSILSGINKACAESCIDVYEISDRQDSGNQFFVGLKTMLSAVERLQLVNELHEKKVGINSSYSLSIQMIINDETGSIESFSAVQPLCTVCTLLNSGVCDNTTEAACRCYNGFTGSYCEEKITPKSSSLSHWPIIVGVISGVAGLLLIICISLCIYYKTRKNRLSKNRHIKAKNSSRKFTIARELPMTMGVTGQDSNDGTNLIRIDNGEQHTDASDINLFDPSSNYNPIHRRNDASEKYYQPNERASLPSSLIPPTQVLTTADISNSFPSDATNNPHGRTNMHSVYNDLDTDSIEFNTDLLSYMIKDDDMDNEFIEAVHPNIVMHDEIYNRY
ncbi:unnamed protein product [Rotaria socialis]|uniref:EGF-like domain-containing protein n=1 Tax=Rotaria socialis TaxID=392032 RepID=A0A818HNA9_9BILA|nr:unnamed protein product [Rotaria socialis]CAF4090690.1 unnamed protein product [Rotaria socialis]